MSVCWRSLEGGSETYCRGLVTVKPRGLLKVHEVKVTGRTAAGQERVKPAQS